ncbi:uncharacterized protein LOC117116711 [Anneissia japonica]|uniref:uncharacterized protein LOC117116711 n=1 Tax=Anneissia japonica TaxID=1529436 RepID=UPI001425B8F3|nr:uncharacterized protein LOC117116711 [Anneissia japonica]
MLLGIVVVYLLVQESVACWSTTDCLPCQNTTVSEPTLTQQQTDALFKLSQELDLLSYQELQERVYNTTESPIDLSDEQMMELFNYFHGLFKKREEQNSTVIAIDEKNFINSTTINVCSSVFDVKRYNLALDRFGNVVYVPQLVKYDSYQEFAEGLCTGTECVSSASCKCKTALSDLGRSIVTYIRRGDPKFYTTWILLNSCTAYIDA